LTETDVRQISEKLTEFGTKYSTSEGGKDILVAPSERSGIRMRLAQYGLPLRKLSIPEQGGLTPQTPKQIDANNLQLLQVDLTESVRQINGVADAYVKVVMPKDDSFSTEKAPSTATVMLKLQPGITLTASQIKGVVHLIAFSVEGLDPKNVKVVDTNGMILSDIPSINDDQNDPSVLTGQQNDKKIAYEQELQKKVQAMLDSTLGPNKARVAVNATLDFSSKTKESKVVGGVGNTSGEVVVKSKTSTETYTSDPNSGDDSSGAVQMSFKGGSADANANYKKVDKTEIKDVNQTIIKVQTPAGTLERLSCSVLVDNLKPNQVAKIQGIVKDAIGIDETRGDSITVESMPFNRQNDEMNDMRAAMAAAPAVTAPANTNMGSVATVAGAGVIAILLVLAVVYMVRQKNVQTEQSRVLLGSNSINSTTVDISDLTSTKNGTSTLPTETKVNTSETLEKLAKNQPTKVAELLKSTWLVDK
jgi:flagellar M-ring protein FliF